MERPQHPVLLLERRAIDMCLHRFPIVTIGRVVLRSYHRITHKGSILTAPMETFFKQLNITTCIALGYRRTTVASITDRYASTRSHSFLIFPSKREHTSLRYQYLKMFIALIHDEGSHCCLHSSCRINYSRIHKAYLDRKTKSCLFLVPPRLTNKLSPPCSST
jgi:hypothetical protein